MVIEFAPRMSIWLLISVFIPWVTLMRPVTAAQPIRIPRRFSANLNFLSLIPPNERKAMS
jgi:hypothetical protein